ncbi:SWIM zinc finger family protein [Phormidium sp. CLA17]|uniref:SWIM zinc finger family protein n=1 Tax=Leptolyngbya sp. Cla-17 TaxID=2803751 RepID=UPI00149229D6|nr:SWIM zinc finger family protein [Leptolyngbya sp. Cla-17]MBM0743562.1 SWIM zinc finger family protein [Leptolyngbya sp. Cla-17]
MPTFSRTWWGKKFIDALESFTDSGRLSRGRSYARGNKVKSFEIEDGIVEAQVRGSVNPYYGVYKEPLYTTVVEIQPISAAKWAAAIALIASKASYISKLLLNEMPDTIEDAFLTLGLNLLPRKRSEFKTSCSCPDYGDPCKHVAGVCYLLAVEFDRDPFLMFELRGLSKAALQAELAKSPLGIALSAELSTQATDPAPVESYYTQPKTITLPPDTSLKEFWQSPKRFSTPEPSTQVTVPAILIKKQGDAPAFWRKDASFIATMEELYERVKTKNRDVLD